MEKTVKTLEMSLEQAQELYKNEPSLRSWLEENFDKKDLKPFHYTDIKTFEDACEKLDIKSDIHIQCGKSSIGKYAVAQYKLAVIFEAINDGWIPDWDNSNEFKWYPWFAMFSVSFGHSRYAGWNAGSDVGSRLCTYSREVSNYIGKQFEDLYREAFLMY